MGRGGAVLEPGDAFLAETPHPFPDGRTGDPEAPGDLGLGVAGFDLPDHLQTGYRVRRALGCATRGSSPATGEFFTHTQQQEAEPLTCQQPTWELQLGTRFTTPLGDEFLRFVIDDPG